MRLEQLRFLVQIVDSGYVISRAAQALGISQPAVSKQIRLLEQELKLEILLRREGRIIGLTEPGSSMVLVARQIIADAASMRRMAEEFTREEGGRLTLATTHINARYVLLHVVERFRRQHPRVQLRVRQGAPSEMADLVLAGSADIAVTSAPPDGPRGLIALPSYTLERSVIAPIGHPLLHAPEVTLPALAELPIITLDQAFAGGQAVVRAFADAGLEAHIVMTATDADVIKAYVELGLGVAILPQIVFDPNRDTKLGSRDVSGLFAPTLIYTCIHPGLYLRQYVYDFIHMVAPEWTRQAVMQRLRMGLV